ncbi:MAG: Holliday junction branch migration protein RuvA [Alphaproteobacteria bacterium]
MIARLRGRVDGTGDDWAVIDVGGVGYLVHCPVRTLGDLARAGGEVALYVETHVREDRIQLFGFMHEAERSWFRLLNSVQGVGARVALGILGTLRVDEIVQAIALQDKAALTRAPSVGPKLAQRIITELKDKAVGLSLSSAARTVPAGTVPEADGVIADAVSALVNLGFAQAQAIGAVAKASRDAGGGADVGTLIRTSLRELSP